MLPRLVPLRGIEMHARSSSHEQGEREDIRSLRPTRVGAPPPPPPKLLLWTEIYMPATREPQWSVNAIVSPRVTRQRLPPSLSSHSSLSSSFPPPTFLLSSLVIFTLRYPVVRSGHPGCQSCRNENKPWVYLRRFVFAAQQRASSVRPRTRLSARVGGSRPR